MVKNGSGYQKADYKKLLALSAPYQTKLAAASVLSTLCQTKLLYQSFGDHYPGNYISSLEIEDVELQALNDISSRNTTLAVIATNISLERSQLIKVAELAHDGMARAIFPVHTMQDGDMIFATSSHSSERKIINHLHIPALINMIGIGAGDALMRAIKNSVLYAQGIEGYPSYSNSGKSEILAS